MCPSCSCHSSVVLLLMRAVPPPPDADRPSLRSVVDGLMVVLAAGSWDAAIVGFGLAGELWLALLCLALAGGADMISGMFRMIIWNQTIPDHLRGRLAGIEMVSYTTGPLLGNTESGIAAVLALMLPTFLASDGRQGLARTSRRRGSRRRPRPHLCPTIKEKWSPLKIN